MVRQCAWCLRLIDSEGERLSLQPVPKLYEASHGICGVCGVQWMEQIASLDKGQLLNGDMLEGGSDQILQGLSSQEAIAQMILQMQERSSDATGTVLPESSTKSPTKLPAKPSTKSPVR